MTLRSLAAAALLVAAGLAGCVSPVPDDGAETASTPGTSALDADDLDAPAGADVEVLEEGIRIAWTDVELPFEETVPVPENATVVQAEAEVAPDSYVFSYMTHADTGAPRCSPEIVESWRQVSTGSSTCSGVTAIDPLPAEWEVMAFGEEDTAEVVSVTYRTGDLGGVAGELELANLSTPEHDALETEKTWVESHDGARLHAEVTRPDVDGPVPTILISTPYAHFDRLNGERPYDEFVRDWVPRGYAVVVADVRGFGESEGCVEVWGPNEQRDQKVLVDWITDQGWSDGSVGFTGVSYVGTTPIEAAVQAPEGLDAVMSVAGVINAYQDWHFGGVPNGENVGSPVAYHSIGTLAEVHPADPVRTARNHGNGLCDPTLLAGANDPRNTYDDYYAVRNLSDRADQIEAPLLYQQGFEDPNVKSSMATDFFNDVEVEKLGLFGHWTHQYAVRADVFLLRLAWMDQFVKDRDLGLEGIQRAEVLPGDGSLRVDDAWPPQDPHQEVRWPDFQDGAWSDEPASGDASVVLEPTGFAGDASAALDADDPTRLGLTTTVDETLQLSGRATVDLAVSLRGAENAHVAAYLFVDDGDGERLVTWGMANLAHRNGHTSYDPVPPDEVVRMGLHTLPAEEELEPGDEVTVVLRSAQAFDWSTRVQPDPAGELTFHGGEDGTRLLLPTVPADDGRDRPLSTLR